MADEAFAADQGVRLTHPLIKAIAVIAAQRAEKGFGVADPREALRAPRANLQPAVIAGTHATWRQDSAARARRRR